MPFLGTLVLAIAKVVSLIMTAYTFIILGSVIVSWVRADPYNPIVRFLHMATDPVYARVRRFMPAVLFRTGLDFTPIIVLILIVFLETIIVGGLNDAAFYLRSAR